MNIEFERDKDTRYFFNYKLTVRDLSIVELSDMVQHNASRPPHDQEIYLCHLIANGALRTKFNSTGDYVLYIPTDSSMNLISSLVDNLGLNKRVLTVAKNAIRNDKIRGSCSIKELSYSKAWREFIYSIDTSGYYDRNVGLRCELIKRVMKNNPEMVFPELQYMVTAYEDFTD